MTDPAIQLLAAATVLCFVVCLISCAVAPVLCPDDTEKHVVH